MRRLLPATALLTLGICIGANAAIFAILNSVVLRPLPVPDSDRLVILYNSYPKAGVERASTGVPDYYDRLRETDVFETFTRLEGSDRKGGTGLGLAIVKGFAEAMGMAVSAANREDGKGAIFVLRFPDALIVRAAMDAST